MHPLFDFLSIWLILQKKLCILEVNLMKPMSNFKIVASILMCLVECLPKKSSLTRSQKAQIQMLTYNYKCLNFYKGQ